MKRFWMTGAALLILVAGQGIATRAGERSRGAIANQLCTVTDDFIVEVYHNGMKVPDSKRELVVERFGATSERINVEVKSGDWIVFNVVNNRLRWGGASYFAAAAKGELGVAFTTELVSGRWSSCDDPSKVADFINDPRSLADNRASAIANPWSEGDAMMNQLVDGWDGKPLWGASRNTWIKYVAQ